jgi:molybdopterin-synthase adenylyltransferase
VNVEGDAMTAAVQGTPAGFPARPRLKPIFDVLYLPGRVRLGSGPAFNQEIDDPDGRWAQLVKHLDGTRTAQELAADLTDVLGAGELADGLTALWREGFVEDADEQPPEELSARDLDRYKVNVNYWATLVGAGGSKYTMQAALKQRTALVIGMGGIGTNVCMALAELGVGHIYGVDFDRVELSNLNRQVLYYSQAVGRRKVDVAAERLDQFNPDIEFHAEDIRLASESDVDRVVAETRPDFVFCLADKPNGYIDFWINRVCVRRGIPIAAAGISVGLGIAYTVEPGVAACYQCRVDGEIAATPHIAEDLDYVRRVAPSASNGALGPACMFMAYFISYEFLRHTLRLAEPLTRNKLFEVDLLTFEQRMHNFPRRAGCSVCGELQSDDALQTA